MPLRESDTLPSLLRIWFAKALAMRMLKMLEVRSVNYFFACVCNFALFYSNRSLNYCILSVEDPAYYDYYYFEEVQEESREELVVTRLTTSSPTTAATAAPAPTSTR